MGGLMKDDFVIMMLLLIVNIFIVTSLIQSANAANANLYVSQEAMLDDLRKKIENMSEHSSDARRYYDLSQIKIEVLDVKVVPMFDDPNYPLDDSDLVIIDFKITNQGIDYFVLSDKMFSIRVYDSKLAEKGVDKDYLDVVDNYSTIYDDELEVRYDDLSSFKIFEDCDYLNDRIFINQPETFTICFDILRRWNNEVLNLDGPKLHYLTMMDNIRFTSCPNCINVLLSSDLTKLDSAFRQNFETNLPIEPPLKQLKAGKLPKDVICKDDFILLLRPENNFPACVSNDTAMILIERGWELIHN